MYIVGKGLVAAVAYVNTAESSNIDCADHCSRTGANYVQTLRYNDLVSSSQNQSTYFRRLAHQPERSMKGAYREC